ncbi:Hypothetical predicted protein [Mytilus galloprovincialis]|uniref:Reverse transcriptase domain-containing protein n=1 Tax=Mytilus galloprovincialis TaxID=29158 RepID=A0A8B6CTD9_MYTGA|nr:Hypothetical predicted protein [Mytilus galloprovincialis]
MDNTYREIDEAAECDVRLFWRLISRQKNRKTNQISEILHHNRKCKSPEDISNAFADFYADVYTPTENSKFDNDFKVHVTEFVDRTLESCATNNGLLPGGEITLYEIETVVRNLKLRKAPGYDKLQNEHVRYSELGCKLYVAFLDSSRAFDTVWHSGLIYKLYQLGINSKALQVISDCYSDITSAVYVNEHVSVPFKVRQGVRQGGVLSTILYLVYINDLLNELELVGTANISNIRTSNPSFADDVVCIGTSPQRLQNMLNCAYDYSLKWRFEFNPLKSVILGYRTELDLVFNLGDKSVNISTETKHLGILRTVDLSPSTDIQHSCRKGRNAYFAIAGTGSCLLNPLTVCGLYNKIVIPAVLYGCELWNGIKPKDIRCLETFQHFIVKHIQGFPKRTRSDMCESMTNLERLPILVEKRKLMFLYKLCEMKAQSLTKQIFIYRLFQYFGDTSRKQTWIHPRCN